MGVLESDDFVLRKEAAEALENLADERTADALIKAMKYEEWQRDYPMLARVRASAARGLGKIGLKEAINPLLEALNDVDLDVKANSIWALGEIGDPQAFEAIREFTDFPDENVRKSAIEALAKIDAAEAFFYLSRALYDESWVVRKTAVKVIGELGDERFLKVLIEKLDDEDVDVKRQVLLALVSIGEPAINPLLKRLHDPSWQTRAMVVEALGDIKSKKAVPHLKRVLSGRKKDKNHYVRGKAAEALGLIADSDAVKALKEAANDKHLFVRRKARAALDLIEVEPELEIFDNGEIIFRYPYFWNLKELPAGDRVIEGFWEDGNLEFGIKRSESQGMTAEDFSEAVIEAFDGKGFFNISRDTLKISDENGYILTAETKTKRIIVFLFERKGHIYYIYFKGALDKIKSSYKFIRVFINTLRVKN